MKKFKRVTSIFLLLLSISYLCACGNGGNASNQLVQHDTVKNGGLIVTSKDSVLKDGEYIKHYSNGVIEMQGVMKEGKRDGVWKSFYEDGLPWSETTFVEGKKNGKTTTWFDNNQKRYEGFYFNDIESGDWTFWDEKGKLVKKQNFDKK